MKKMAKRVLATALAFMLVLGLCPADVSAATTTYQLTDGTKLVFSPSSQTLTLKEGVATTDQIIGRIGLSGGKASISNPTYGFKLYDNQSTLTNSEYTNQGITVSVVNDLVYLKTDNTVKKNTTPYYLALTLTGTVDGESVALETSERYAITVGDSQTGTQISNVSITVPSTLTVGDTLSSNIVKTSLPSNAQYDFSGAISMSPYDVYYSDANTKNENVVNKSRYYMMIVKLAAKENYYFPASASTKSGITKPTDYSSNYYIYSGAVSSTVACKSTAVQDSGKTLVLAFEYLVDGNGQTIVSNNGNTQPTQGLVSVWGNATTNIAVTTVGTAATLADIDQATVNSITNGTTQANIVLDLSATNSAVTTGIITYDTMTRFVNSVNSTANGMKALEMRLPKATAILDAASLNSIVSQAGGSGDLSVTLNEITTDNLTATQRAGLTGNTILKVIRATTKVGSKDITSFGAGYETISLPYTLTTGQSADKIYVAHIASNGTLTKVSSSYANNRVTFTTNHNSDFVVIHEKTDVNADLYPVYRAYNPNSGDHLLTVNQDEYNIAVRAGWTAEGTPFKVSKTQGDAIYRLYNPNTGEHLYTKILDEKNVAVRAGWKDEGTPFRSYGDVPVYRVYNPNQEANNHLFTTSLTERNNLINLGWKEGNIVFYVNAK